MYLATPGFLCPGRKCSYPDNIAIAFAALKYLDPDLYEIEFKNTKTSLEAQLSKKLSEIEFYEIEIHQIKFEKLIEIVKKITGTASATTQSNQGGKKNIIKQSGGSTPQIIYRGQYALDTRASSAREELKKLRFIDSSEVHDKKTIHYHFYKTVAEYNRRTEGSLEPPTVSSI